MWDRILKFGSAASGALVGFIGGFDPLFSILAAAILLDYLSGLIVAWRGRSHKTETGGISSKISFDGLARKAFIFLIVLLSALLDAALGNDAKMFQTAATCYYIANEGISILENAALMGVPFPKRILDSLEAMRSGNDGKQGGKPDEDEASGA